MALDRIEGFNLYIGGLVFFLFFSCPRILLHLPFRAFRFRASRPTLHDITWHDIANCFLLHFLYSVISLRNKTALQQANITHVVSVLRMRPDETLTESFQHFRIEVDDVEDEDLLQYFASANAFIQSGLDAGGSVLVHWFVLFPLPRFPRFLLLAYHIKRWHCPYLALRCPLSTCNLYPIQHLSYCIFVC
jgi:Dual specificity phosphatase, catalytic domain